MATSEHDLARERIACVFGLGGGELHEADERFPDEWDGVVPHWYEGVPEYITLGDLRLDLDDEVRTAILCCIFGHQSPPEGWVQVASYSSLGEATCWSCGAGDDGDVEGCKLCDGDGLIYLGDGWCEVAYCRAKET